MISQVRRGAVHEAGHAVFAVLTNYPFQVVRVNPTGAGHLLGKDDDSDEEVQFVPMNDDICTAVVALAGEMAERSILGDCDSPGLAKDREFLGDALRGLANDADHEMRIEQRCRLQLEKLIETPAIRSAVERVAEILERRMNLTAAEVEELVPADARRAYEESPNIETS